MNVPKLNINNSYNEEEYIYCNSQILRNKKLFVKNKISISYKYLIIILSVLYLLTTFFILRKLNYYRRKYNNDKKNTIPNKIFGDFDIISNNNRPFLPENENDIINKNYVKSYYNDSNIRFHFEDLFFNRKIFMINYSYLPYENIDKYKSYEDNANYIYEKTGMLNITKLDNIYYNKNSINYSNYNHIHLSMGHDKNYILLSLVSIASILNTTNSDTFIHFHFVLLDCKFDDMKPIISLKGINQNVEFIFYDGKQAEYDFSIFGKNEGRGIGDYTKFLIPQIVNNTNKIIILDSADIIAKKDLSEIYFFDLGNNYFGFALDVFAGKNDNMFVFAKNKFYANIGACLVNIRLFRKDKLYMAGYFARLAYSYLPCPTQEMFFLVSQYKIKFFPLIYNYPQFYNNDEEKKRKIQNTSLINFYTKGQENSPFRYTINEIIEGEENQVINHLFFTKPYLNLANKENGKIWVDYAKLAKVDEKLKVKYPQTFKLYDIRN